MNNLVKHIEKLNAQTRGRNRDLKWKQIQRDRYC